VGGKAVGRFAQAPSGTGKFGIFQIGLNLLIAQVDVRRLKQSRTEIVIFVRHVRRAEQEVTGLSLDFFIANREAGRAVEPEDGAQTKWLWHKDTHARPGSDFVTIELAT
jgi:hypothetical protein